MKITNWRRKLSAALMAGGLLVPSAAQSAGLNTNLVTNGDFETVNLAVTGGYNGPLVLGWTGPNLFAYSHDGSSSNAGVVPDYADGADPPNAGHWYFTPNNTNVADPTDVHDPGVYFQDISVGTGDTGAAIVLTHVSVMAMTLLLEEVAAQLPAGTHVVMLVDNAGWHVANELHVPPNISLVHLPPYSPELNAIEKVWQYLRDRYLSGRMFTGTRAIVDACCDAWNKLIAETGRIRSLTDFDWARPVSP